MNHQEHVDKLVVLIMAFHAKTGAPIEEIKAFVKDIGDATFQFTNEVTREIIKERFDRDN